MEYLASRSLVMFILISRIGFHAFAFNGIITSEELNELSPVKDKLVGASLVLGKK